MLLGSGSNVFRVYAGIGSSAQMATGFLVLIVNLARLLLVGLSQARMFTLSHQLRLCILCTDAILVRLGLIGP